MRLLGVICVLLALHMCAARHCRPSALAPGELLCDDGAKYHVLAEPAEEGAEGEGPPAPITCTRPDEEGMVECAGHEYHHGSIYTPPDRRFYTFALLSMLLIGTAGIVSGLQLGLLSIDCSTLQVLINAGQPDQQHCAKKIAPLVKRRHMLLVCPPPPPLPRCRPLGPRGVPPRAGGGGTTARVTWAWDARWRRWAVDLGEAVGPGHGDGPWTMTARPLPLF